MLVIGVRPGEVVRISRRATGTIIEKDGRDGQKIRSLRFTAYGKRRYLTLGAVSAAQAERELQQILTDVEQGSWRAPHELASRRRSSPTGFRALAEEWWSATTPTIAPATQRGYRWRLDRHLLPYFADLRLEEITSEAIERYIAGKLSEPQPLSAGSINTTVTLLGAVLESAVERALIARNPVRPRRPRLPEAKPERNHLESAAQIEVLLQAASELDHAAAPAPVTSSVWRCSPR